MDSYIICSTPRTGSTLLCDLLASTGVAGDPDSFFMRDVDPVWARRWCLPARDGLSEAEYCAAYLRAAIAAGRGATPIMGLRLMRENLDDLSATIYTVYPGLPSDRDRLQAAFGEILYIHLTREDKLAQAVSLVRAEQSGLWHMAPDGTELERMAPPREPEYDFHRIGAKLAELERFDAGWRSWFEDQGIVPLKVGYESLSETPAEAVGRICRSLGVPEPEAGSLKANVAKLSDATNAEWVRRYRAEADLVT